MSVHDPDLAKNGHHRPRGRGAILLAAFAVVEVVVIVGLVFTLPLWVARLLDLGPWLLGLGAALTAIGPAYLAYRMFRFAARRRFRFSLRTLLLLQAVFALLLGTIGLKFFRVWKQERAVSYLMALGGEVGYDYNPTEEKEPSWLESHVSLVELTSDQGIDALLERSEALPELQRLSLSGPGITDAGFTKAERLSRFTRLEGVHLLNTKISDEGLRKLNHWTNLKTLGLASCSGITDAGLACLKDTKCLEYLALALESGGTMNITDAGLASVGEMSQLRSLILFGFPITDAGLARLENLTNLEQFSIRGTQVTKQGMHKLKLALPDCWIISDVDGNAFPGVEQTRQISIWKLSTSEKRIASISQPDRIAAIAKCLDGFQGAGREDPDSAPCLQINFEGPNRCICKIRLGDGFLQTPLGVSWYCRFMSAAEQRQLLGLLGISMAGVATNSTPPANADRSQSPVPANQLR